MPFISCPSCQKQISSRAPYCPFCKRNPITGELLESRPEDSGEDPSESVATKQASPAVHLIVFVLILIAVPSCIHIIDRTQLRNSSGRLKGYGKVNLGNGYQVYQKDITDLARNKGISREEAKQYFRDATNLKRAAEQIEAEPEKYGLR